MPGEQPKRTIIDKGTGISLGILLAVGGMAGGGALSWGSLKTDLGHVIAKIDELDAAIEGVSSQVQSAMTRIEVHDVRFTMMQERNARLADQLERLEVEVDKLKK